MKKKLISMLLLLTLVCATVLPAFAVTTAPIRVILELDGQPLSTAAGAQGVDGFIATPAGKQALLSIAAAQSQSLSALENLLKRKPTVSHRYRAALNGYAVELFQDELPKVSAMEGVHALIPIGSRRVSPAALSVTDKAATADTATTTAAPVRRTALPYQGESMVIAIVDGGADVHHELFTLSDPKRAKIHKEDLAVEALSLPSKKPLTADDVYQSSKIPFAYDYADNDTDVRADLRSDDIHGTHVSGIAAANNRLAPAAFEGVAPEAQLLIMKVFSDQKEQLLQDEDLIAAIEDSMLLGADAINVSLGSDSGFTYNQTGVLFHSILNRANNLGIAVVASAGNSDRVGYNSSVGALPLSSNIDSGMIGDPASYQNIVAVASAQSPVLSMQSFRAGTQSIPYVLVFNEKGELADISTTLHKQELAYVPVPNTGTKADYAGLDVTGKIALVERGTITFDEKELAARDAGAVGILFYDNVKEPYPSVTTTDRKLPAALISSAHGKKLLALEHKTVRFNRADFSVLAAPDAGRMSPFTAWGCTPDLKLKPELTALGGNVWSSTPDNRYAMQSGTSMAAPQVSGASVLIKQYMKAHPKEFPLITGATISALLMSTAVPVLDHHANPYSPRRQGNGLMNVAAALSTPVVLAAPDGALPKANLGADSKKSGVYSFSFVMRNHSAAAQTYRIDTDVLTDTAVKSKDGFVTQEYPTALPDTVVSCSYGTGEKISDSVTVPAHGETCVLVRLRLSAQAKKTLDQTFENGAFIEGFVRLTSDQNPSLSFPFMGFYGNWGDAPILDHSIYDSKPAYFTGCSAIGNLGSMQEHSLIKLGCNYYNPQGKASMPDLEKIAFSPNDDGVADVIGMELSLLRNAKAIVYQITDPTGKVAARIVDHNLTKSAYNFEIQNFALTDGPLWDGVDLDNKVHNNARYTFRATIYLDAAVLHKQTWSFDFCVDLRAPKLLSQTVVQKDGKTYLCVKAKDNQYLQGATLSNKEETVFQEKNLCDTKKNTTATMYFDLTDVENGKYELSVSDYAFNESITPVTVKKP